MQFKLLIAFVDDDVTEAVMKEARRAGATGATIINNARGEGIKRQRTFFGMQLETQRDVLLFVVERHLARKVLERIAKIAGFDDESGKGIAIQIDVEDAVGVAHQIERLKGKVEEEL
ncbi:nitrogen regulatory protein P-II [Thalassotalea insulae]|uniref:Nitrogen regulatory protein P-II n=1 Tax=Thalassotalea insulae TaxID=2056778 RepID=A0ABQ6GUC7_9GAMM|nr:P-II family nitrogen regulator [Thalassotalea insulae]GLX79528.1 nitrogen regulatory protein P-II [Thalassotalea insulae]